MMSFIFAHRGASAQAPENTLEAFSLAISMGADGLELDVHLSSDGELMVIHDAKVDRTTNGTGLIREKTLAEIKALDAGSWKGEQFAGEKVPTFEELLEGTEDQKLLLGTIDILIDGPFLQAQKSLEIAFRGSRNQRILDVKKSLAEGRAVETSSKRWLGEY